MRSVTAGRGGHGGASRRNGGTRAARATRQAGLHAVKDFETLFADAEALLHSTVDVVGDQASQARARLQKSLVQAKDRLAEDIESLQDHGLEAISAADDFVHRRPWPVIGLAALAAVSAGFFLSRR
jgi:ElaB/YqjD/DUF883 family membrane-anchored ribosome-binding protein